MWLVVAVPVQVLIKEKNHQTLYNCAAQIASPSPYVNSSGESLQAD